MRWAVMNWTMQSPSKLDLSETPLVLDTSVLINLIASNQIEAVAAALARPLLIEECVVIECCRDPRDGSDGRRLIATFADAGVLRVINLNEKETEQFIAFAGAPAPDDLGDGESATLACALERGYAVIDERKATRIAARDFPELRLISSLDLLCSSNSFAKLGEDGVAQAVQSAIKIGRMRVPHSWQEWLRCFLAKSPMVSPGAARLI